MDARKVADADLSTAPAIQRKSGSALAPTTDPHSAKAPASKRFLESFLSSGDTLTIRWALAVFVAGIVANLGIEVFATAPAADSVAPVGLELAALELFALALMFSPLLSVVRTKAAAGVGLVGSLGFLGFLGECFISGHNGFFDVSFLGMGVVMLGLAGVCVGALASGRR